MSDTAKPIEPTDQAPDLVVLCEHHPDSQRRPLATARLVDRRLKWDDRATVSSEGISVECPVHGAVVADAAAVADAIERRRRRGRPSAVVAERSFGPFALVTPGDLPALVVRCAHHPDGSRVGLGSALLIGGEPVWDENVTVIGRGISVECPDHGTVAAGAKAVADALERSRQTGSTWPVLARRGPRIRTAHGP